MLRNRLSLQPVSSFQAITMYDICCVGHITLDKIVNNQSTTYLPGGTSWYFSKALQQLQPSYLLVTSLATEEQKFVTQLQDGGTQVTTFPSAATICFENIYSNNQDHRTQRVTQKADPFTIEQLQDINAGIFHLGPLVTGDIPMETIPYLAEKAKVSLDVQGYLREVREKSVVPLRWKTVEDYLPHITYLKANETEMELLTGYPDMYEAAAYLVSWGVKEVIVTKGSQGSMIFADRIYHHIPAFSPTDTVDATGCGDTYMAGYLYQRIKGATVKKAGYFAAGMATLKIQQSGAFNGTEQDVLALLESHKEIQK